MYVIDFLCWYKGGEGEVGPPGRQGFPGIKGDRGMKGETGAPGKSNATVIPGEKGDKGDPGIAGPPGINGRTSYLITCTAYVSLAFIFQIFSLSHVYILFLYNQLMLEKQTIWGVIWFTFDQLQYIVINAKSF